MKTWKSKLLLALALFIGVAIFGYIMHQRIVASSPSPANIETRDDSLGSLCGMIVGSGLVLIWLVPFLQKFGEKLGKKFTKS